MANEPSFFERLTGGAGSAKGGAKSSRVDFAEDPASASPDTESESVTIAAASQEEPEAPRPVPQQKPTEERHEQWMEEAQEGQLTIDVFQTDTDIVIRSTVAGVKAEDLDIAITNDMVTIRGKRARDEEISPDRYFYQECYWGPFSRSVILPADVASDKADASLKNGILTIRLPKIEKEQTKKIKVKPLA